MNIISYLVKDNPQEQQFYTYEINIHHEQANIKTLTIQYKKNIILSCFINGGKGRYFKNYLNNITKNIDSNNRLNQIINYKFNICKKHTFDIKNLYYKKNGKISIQYDLEKIYYVRINNRKRYINYLNRLENKLFYTNNFIYRKKRFMRNNIKYYSILIYIPNKYENHFNSALFRII